MADLQSLLSEMATLDAAHDFDGLRRVRERIVLEHPDADAAVEALYKIGLDLLFRERKLDDAVERFAEASKRKQPFWSAAARTSLGLCYYHQRRTQKALFELRKVGYAKVPNVHSVTALAFIENIFETEGNSEEATRVRKDRIVQLEQVIQLNRDAKGDAAERAYHLYQLGLALKDHREADRAKLALEEAKALGPQILGADLYRSVVDALSH
jgi:tetratricopeptide (TPR) repeat protein